MKVSQILETIGETEGLETFETTKILNLNRIVDCSIVLREITRPEGLTSLKRQTDKLGPLKLQKAQGSLSAPSLEDVPPPLEEIPPVHPFEPYQVENEPSTSSASRRAGGHQRNQLVDLEPLALDQSATRATSTPQAPRRKSRVSKQKKAARHLAQNFAARKFASVGARERGLTPQELIGDLPEEED